MILNTSLEFVKFDKTQINMKNKEIISSFLNDCKMKEIDYFNNKNLEFNQLEFYHSYRGKNEDLDKLINYLVQEYNQYNIKDKTEYEIKNIIKQYYTTIPDKVDLLKKFTIIFQTFELRKIMNSQQIEEIKKFLELKEN